MQDYSKYLAKGEAKSTATKLIGKMRNPNQGDPLQEGDVFTIPVDFMSVCYDSVLKDNDGNTVQFLMLEVKNSNTGAEKCIHFFPNQIAKVFYPVTENGDSLPRIKTAGEVTDKYLSALGKEDDMNEGVKAIAGRAIKVTADEPVRVKRYESEETYTTHKYTYEWAD